MPFSVIVFDLDFTLWDAGGTWCDQTFPPYRRINDHVVDSENNTLVLYPGIRSLLKELYTEYILAVASRTQRPGWARELMRLFDILHYFRYLEMYPGSKTEHFYSLHKQSNIPYSEMLFYDDEKRNILEVSRLGVTTVLVENGMNRKMIEDSLYNTGSL